MECSRQNVMDVLNKAGYYEAAERVAASLPERVDLDVAADFLLQYGICDQRRADQPPRW
jgi:hypothetical protein